MDIELSEIINRNAAALGERDKYANKGTYGKLLVIGGSCGMSGAAYLCSLAAFRTGIGMVKVFGPECNRVILQSSLPEAMYKSMELSDGSIDKAALKESVDWADHIVVGPGLSKGTEAVELMRVLGSDDLAEALSSKKMLLYDADALNIISMFISSSGHEADVDNCGRKLLSASEHTVITPHIGEMARLTGLEIDYIKAHQKEVAGAFADKYGVNVVLKDAVTAVALRAKSGKAMLIDSGCGAMAKAGSGDVLCGFISGVSAVLQDALNDSIPTAVFLHGRAGCIASDTAGCHSVLAEDIANSAGKAILSCIKQ